jgi:hypothetical protein
MNSRRALLLALVGLMSVWPLDEGRCGLRSRCAASQPGVPQVITMEGKFVRARMQGGYVSWIPGSNRSIGEEWMPSRSV